MPDQESQLFATDKMAPVDRLYAHYWLRQRREQAQEPFSAKRSLRRSIKRGMAATAIAMSTFCGALQVNNEIGEALRRPEPGHIEVVSSGITEAEEAELENIWVFMPGTNVPDSAHIAAAFPSLEDKAAMEYKEPYSFEAVYEQIETFALRNDIERVNLYGQSQAGAMALEIAGKLYHEHGITVPMVALDCTPLGLDSTDLAPLDNEFMIWLFQQDFFSSPAAKLAGNYAFDAWQSGDLAQSFTSFGVLMREFAQARQRMREEKSIFTADTIQKMIYLARYDQAQAFDDLPPRTNVLYIAPERTSADHYVQTEEVIDRIKSEPSVMIARLAIQSHASPWRYPDAYNQALTIFGQKAEGSPVQSPKSTATGSSPVPRGGNAAPPRRPSSVRAARTESRSDGSDDQPPPAPSPESPQSSTPDRARSRPR